MVHIFHDTLFPLVYPVLELWKIFHLFSLQQFILLLHNYTYEFIANLNKVTYKIISLKNGKQVGFIFHTARNYWNKEKSEWYQKIVRWHQKNNSI